MSAHKLLCLLAAAPFAEQVADSDAGGVGAWAAKKATDGGATTAAAWDRDGAISGQKTNPMPVSPKMTATMVFL